MKVSGRIDLADESKHVDFSQCEISKDSLEQLKQKQMKTKEEIEEQIKFAKDQIKEIQEQELMFLVKDERDEYLIDILRWQVELSTLNWILGKEPF